MHALFNASHLAPIPQENLRKDDTVQKRPFLFLIMFFSRNKDVHVDYFDLKVCGYALFLNFRNVQNYSYDVLWLQQYTGHNHSLYHTDLSMDRLDSV